jgi:hypothetical protein
MATRKKKNETWPKITVGTHLTVTEFEDGRTILAWDHDALQRECEEAIASVGKTDTVTTKKRKK